MKIPLAVLALTLALVACEGPEGPMGPAGVQGEVSKVVGAWVLDNWSDAIILSDDGTATYAEESGGLPGRVRGSGTWSTSGNTLRIKVISGYLEIKNSNWYNGETLTATYSTAGNALILTINENDIDNEIFVFVRVL